MLAILYLPESTIVVGIPSYVKGKVDTSSAETEVLKAIVKVICLILLNVRTSFDGQVIIC